MQPFSCTKERSLFTNLLDVRPIAFYDVPRVCEKLQKEVMIGTALGRPPKLSENFGFDKLCLICEIRSHWGTAANFILISYHTVFARKQLSPERCDPFSKYPYLSLCVFPPY